MDNLKEQLKRQLISNALIDKLKNNRDVIFSESWCSHKGTVRFTTPFLADLLGKKENRSGIWENGIHALYETEIASDSLEINCVVDENSLNYEELITRDKLTDKSSRKEDGKLYLHSWKLTDPNGDINKVLDNFDKFIFEDIPLFELSLKNRVNDKKDEVLEEGDPYQTVLNKYERNRKAREKCLAYYGRRCMVCGIDFGVMYGPAFADKIEVHHIVPISEIKENYVVDPIKDLVPVCPNCHTALHSKKDGVYTIEELKEIRSKR